MVVAGSSGNPVSVTSRSCFALTSAINSHHIILIAFTREYDIERKWHEARLYQTAPISTNLILAYIGQHVLGLPRSY
jgi:alkylation response protein AidB-like acyl-CoA dehydrogenase